MNPLFFLGFFAFSAIVFLTSSSFYDKAECVGLAYSDEKRQEVIIGEAGGIVVEEYHEEHRHEIHHPLHAGI